MAVKYKKVPFFLFQGCYAKVRNGKETLLDDHTNSNMETSQSLVSSGYFICSVTRPRNSLWQNLIDVLRAKLS